MCIRMNYCSLYAANRALLVRRAASQEESIMKEQDCMSPQLVKQAYVFEQSVSQTRHHLHRYRHHSHTTTSARWLASSLLLLLGDVDADADATCLPVDRNWSIAKFDSKVWWISPHFASACYTHTYIQPFPATFIPCQYVIYFHQCVYMCVNTFCPSSMLICVYIQHRCHIFSACYVYVCALQMKLILADCVQDQADIFNVRIPDL